jgi:hypothetical protein
MQPLTRLPRTNTYNGSFPPLARWSPAGLGIGLILEVEMNWDQFLQAERARKMAFVQHLLSQKAPIPRGHEHISRQLILEHQQYIAEIDALASRS